MNHNLKFYPLGNADTTLIKLGSGKTILIDYANKRNGSPDDRRCNLPLELNKDVTNDYFDVVAFTHADLDHVCKFSDYFYLQHAVKYQAGNRKKINELWVPAQVIIEEGCDDETRILRAEARHRLRNKKGIKVFSNPEKLQDWLEKEGIAPEEVQHLIINAGLPVPGWDNTNAELEIFIHAPFSYHYEGTEIDRNDVSLVFQATFRNQYETKLLFLGDANWELLHHIVAMSDRFNNLDRLHWDLLHISHHCSYLSLGPEKGETQTEPVDPVRRLIEEFSNEKSVMISPSGIIPSDYDATQPPHRQAYNYYKAIADQKQGEILVTMAFPDQDEPKPIEIVINQYGLTVLKTIIPAGFTSERQTPKAG